MKSKNGSQAQQNYYTNPHGFGSNYLKQISQHMRVSQALKLDPKI
jgi:hypothetical protein